MEVMLAKKKPMSELAAPLKIYPQVLENVRVTDKKAAQNDPVVQEAVSKVAVALGDTGRILARESGTEPVVRVMVEAPDHDTCQKYVDEVVNVICEKGYKVWTLRIISRWSKIKIPEVNHLQLHSTLCTLLHIHQTRSSSTFARIGRKRAGIHVP